VDPDLKIQLITVLLLQFLMYFAACSIFIFCMIYGTWDRISIYIGFVWLSTHFIGLQYMHILIILAVLKRLRLMNQSLKRIDSLNLKIVKHRRFAKKTLLYATKIFHHLHNISEVTSFTFSMVSTT
jgi:hypothetical protein